MISVVVPTHNGGEKLRLCLEALAATQPPPAEIIVVNDAGQDDLTYARELGAKVITLSESGGPARARNEGARVSGGDIIFFVDADVVVPPDALGMVAEVFEQEPDVAAIFGSYDDEPAEPDFFSTYRNLLHHYVHQQARTEATTFWGACGAIRRADFERTGGFDETRYRIPSIEDIDLGIRLKRAGGRIKVVRALQVKHLKKWSARSILRTDFFQRAIPWSEVILREGEIVNDLNTSIGNRMSVALVLIGSLALAASPALPQFLILAGLCALLLLGLNLRLYLFFARKRSMIFAAATVPWHWLLFLQSGIAFLLVAVRSIFRSELTLVSTSLG